MNSKIARYEIKKINANEKKACIVDIQNNSGKNT
jgi:hypothetical protein